MPNQSTAVVQIWKRHTIECLKVNSGVYEIDGSLLRTIQSLCTNCSSCVRVNGAKLTPLNVGVGLRRRLRLVTSPSHYIYGLDVAVQPR